MSERALEMQGVSKVYGDGPATVSARTMDPSSGYANETGVARNPEGPPTGAATIGS